MPHSMTRTVRVGSIDDPRSRSRSRSNSTSTLRSLLTFLRSCVLPNFQSAASARRRRIVNYRKLIISCACGQVPGSLSTVGLTADHQLVVHWRCPRCNREMHVSKSLAECWRDCPEEKDTGRTDSQSISDKGSAVFDDAYLEVEDHGC
jgi:hypothetical protein